MQVVKTFNHPLHFVNYVRKCIRMELAKEPKKEPPQVVIPRISKEFPFYFCFETQVDDVNNEVRWGLVCFDTDGVHQFSDKGKFWCGPWHWRRQGIAKMASQIQGVIVSSFRKRWYPIHRDCPFTMVGDGVYQVNWNWAIHKQNLKLVYHD